MKVLTAQFTMRPGKVAQALRLVRAVQRQSEAEQPGTLFYLVHRVRDAKSQKPTRTLLFYECYRDSKALAAHLESTAWKALTKQWKTCFEGTPKTIDATFLQRLGGFVRLSVS